MQTNTILHTCYLVSWYGDFVVLLEARVENLLYVQSSSFTWFGLHRFNSKTWIFLI